jgi:hypothetical protein
MIPAAPYEAPVSLACGIGGYWMPAFAGMTPNERWD